ncbi:MAG TPA: hypothetical protein VH186_15220 [Chloroflexia bacterium]|nr:hypothetical protein [Chloroflexia bacterium]
MKQRSFTLLHVDLPATELAMAKIPTLNKAGNYLFQSTLNT